MNHKSITTIVAFFVLALVVILVTAVPAAARAERIYFTGEDCPIYIGPPGRQWVSGDGVLHQRDVPMINTLTYDSVYTSGMGYFVANFDIDLATGAVHAFGTFEIYPNGAAGTWVGHFSTHVSPVGVVDGSGVLHGTGVMEGMISFISISSPDAPDPACFNMNTASTGYILLPPK